MTPLQEAIKKALLNKFPEDMIKGVPEEKVKKTIPIQEVGESQLAMCAFMIRMERAQEKLSCYPSQEMRDMGQDDFLSCFADEANGMRQSKPNGFSIKSIGASDWGYEWKKFF